MKWTVILLFWCLLAICTGWLLRWLWARQVSQQRLSSIENATNAERENPQEFERSWLGWWLYRAGFRSPNASSIFLGATGLMMLIAIGFVVAVYQAQLVDLLAGLLRALPGGVGEVFLPFVWISPFLGAMVLVSIPWVIVRSRRRQRIRLFEQDLPLTLDLLATLAEAGLGFDGALDRVLETQRRVRPLAEEFRLFQLDILAGRSRLQALVRLKKNVEVPWFSIFVSALIHAEQVGSSLAQTLRAQADDLRNRRRERALALAMGVSVKLLFPLIICFLPGIMVAALGPIIFQIIQVLDQFLRGSLGQ